MDPNVEEALKKVSTGNKLILVAMGALFVASLKATQSIIELNEVLKREVLAEAAEADPIQKMDQIIEDYSERVN